MNIPRFLHFVSLLLGFALAAAVAGCAGPTNERATSASDSRTASSESTVRQAAADPAAQRFNGRYTHMADTGSFVDCRSGQRLVVATEGNNRALEST